MKKYKYKPKIQKPSLSIEERITQSIEMYSKDFTASANKIANKGKPKTKSTSVTALRNKVERAVRDVNQRLRRLEREGKTSSYAYRKMVEQYGKNPKVEIKSKTKQGLENKLKEMRAFQKMKSSTLKGQREIEKKQEEKLKDEGLIFENKKERDEFFDLFNSFMEANKKRGKTKKQYNSYQIRSLMYDSYMNQSKKGEIDKKKLYASVRAKVRYWENKQKEVENEDIFETLKERRKEQTRLRPQRSR